MKRVRMVLDPAVPADLVGEVRERLVYAWERIREHQLADDGATLDLTIDDDADSAEAEQRVRSFVAPMVKRHPAVERVVVFEHRVRPAYSSPIASELEARRAVILAQHGQATLTEDAVDVLEALDRRFAALARDVFAAKSHYYPTMIATSSLDRIQYFASFPHHVTFAFPLREDVDVIQNVAKESVTFDSNDFLGLLRKPAQVLTPAACFNTYVHFQDRPLPEPTVITARVRCFRYESRNMTSLERLWEFAVREIVFLGPQAWVEERRKMAVDAAARFVEELGLDAWIETANDPFFVNNFVARRFFQLAQHTKYELRLGLPYAGDKSLAAASFNLHLDFFGKGFGIARDDAFAFTGCVGFGLERWVWALFAQLGPRVRDWPVSVRRALALE